MSSPENPTITNLYSSLVIPMTWTCLFRCKLLDRDSMLFTLNNLIEKLRGRKCDVALLNTTDENGHNIQVPFKVGTMAQNQGANELKDGDFLGYAYSITGEVVSGDKIGRQLGFPTANLQLTDVRKLLPAAGVYAVQVWVDGRQYGGMLNIGVRPTVLANGEARIEVHIFDFSQEIYGASVQIKLLAYIRGEQYFSDRESLAFQLKQDQIAIQTFLSKYNGL